VPEDLADSLRSSLMGAAHALDVGSVRDVEGRQEYFNNTIGIGFDAAVTIHSRRITAIHGFMMYFVATMQTILRNFTPLDLHVETEIETWDETEIMLTLGNGPREGGGFIVAPEARLDDGRLNYCAIRKISRLMMFRLVPEFMKGTQGRFQPVRMGTCQRMVVDSRQPLFVHLDGEIFSGFETKNRHLSIEVLPGAIHLIKE
jgi:diacylglycerol kinase family enzyme